jgi:hypothetical protein
MFGLVALKGSSNAFFDFDRREQLDGLLVSLVLDGRKVFFALRKILRKMPPLV